MDYQKKVLALKQVTQGFSVSIKPVSAIARIESENGVSDFYLSTINIAPARQGCYRCYICDGKDNLFEFDLGARPLSFHTQFAVCPFVEKGFAVGIYFVKDHLPTPVCFACSESFFVDKTALNKKVAEKCLLKYKNTAREPIEKESPLVDEYKTLKEIYDDEAVATENYYETEKQIQTSQEKIEEFSRERISHKNEFFDCRSQEETSKGAQGFDCAKNETPAFDCKNNQERYYLTVQKELEDVFNKFEKELDLCARFEQSRWAKINYAKDKFYVVGVINQDGYPKYVCYGVPDDNPQKPPKELEGFCSFVKTFPNTPKKQGYWMMFQDADSGRCIRQPND